MKVKSFLIFLPAVFTLYTSPINATRLDGMPNEVIDMIMRSLTPKDHVALASTCREFYKLGAHATYVQMVYNSIYAQFGLPSIDFMRVGESENLYYILGRMESIKKMGGDESAIKELKKLGAICARSVDPFLTISIIARKQNFFTSSMSRDDLVNILDALAQYKMDQIEAFALNSHCFFTSDTCAYDRAIVIKALANSTVDRINAIASYSHCFFTSITCAYDRAIVIKALANSTVDRINAIASYSHKFLNKHMDDEDRVTVFRALADLTESKIKVVSESIDCFFTSTMKHYDRILNIRALAVLTENKIKVVAEHRDRFLSDMMKDYIRPIVVEALCNLTENQIKWMAEKGVVGDFVKDVLKRGEAGMVNDDGSYIPLAELERIKNQWTLK